MTNGSCDCQSNSIAYPTGYGSGYVRYVPNANLLTSFLLQSIIWLSLLTHCSLWPLPPPPPPPPATPSSRSAQSLAILRARDQCFRSERLSPTQRLALDRQLYSNVPHVHRYVYCFWTRLHLWHDGTGFDPIRIVESFGGPRRLNLEQTVPAINGCNAHARRSARTALDWCYGAFVCVLHTRVGDWYRRHMQDVINGNA